MLAPGLEVVLTQGARERLQRVADVACAQRVQTLLRRVAADGGHWPLAEEWNVRAEATSYSLRVEGLLLFYEVDHAQGVLLLLDVAEA